ncbi:MAG: TolC family protein [Candidatus Eisenbacteria bacterium]|nr:TolC family protein [Candidatus Eisenbacteria bacterium]
MLSRAFATRILTREIFLLAVSGLICVAFCPVGLAADRTAGAPSTTQNTATEGQGLSAIATTTTPATQIEAPNKLSLDQSIEIALRNNKQLLVQRQEVERMKGQVTQARATAFPSLSGNASYVKSQGKMNYGGSGGFTFNLDDSYYGGSLSLVQPIYTAGRVGGALRAAHAARSYAQENLLATTKDVVYAVKASFGAVLLAQEMATLAKESLELADAHLANVDQLFKQGVASEYELIRAKVQVAQLLPDRIKAENELDRALIVFRNTLGLPADDKVAPEGELERKDVEITTADAFRLAKENSHELAAARLRVSGMKAALDVAKSDRYPSLSFVGAALMETKEPRWKSEDWRSRTWTASLALSIPMFDGLRTKGKISQTKAEYEQAGLYAAQTEDAVRLEVEQSVSQLAQARQLIQSQVASIEQAQKGLDIANIRYKNGVGTQLEVLDAQVALSTARTNYFTSVYEYFMAVAALERATSVTFE